MNEFKKGDKIRIKDEVSHLTHRTQFPHFMGEMDKMKDKVLTIRNITSRGIIKVEEYGYNLHPEWVEKVKRTPEDKAFDDFLASLEPIERTPEDDSLDSVVSEILREMSEELGGLSYCDKASILEEAQEILEGERDSDYGDPVANFNRISRIASSILDYTISPEECVVVMMAVKLSREQYKHKRDNLVDLVAYTEILNRVRELNK